MDIRVDSEWVICFDLDDTLYNEKDYLRSAFKEIASKLEKESDSLLLKMIEFFERDRDVFQWVEREYGVSKTDLIEAYRNHQPSINPFKGIPEIFDFIKSKGGKIAIVTDGRSKTQRRKLKALGLESYIDLIVISEEIGSEKPSLKNFQIVEDKLGGKRHVYIADNYSKDFLAPNQLGWITIALRDNGENIHQTGPHQAKEEIYLPSIEIDSMKELLINYLK